LTTPHPKSKNLQTLIARLEKEGRRADPGAVGELALPAVIGEPMERVDPVRELVYSMLLWDAGAAKASAACRRLVEGVVDVNELRTCLEDELVRLLGPRYPRATERAARLRAALHHIYRAHNTVSLAVLQAQNKRDARAYLDSIPGVPAYAGARVALLSLGGHAFPVDRRVHRVLADADALESDTSSEGAGAWVERQIRAGEALDAYLLLEAEAERVGASGRRSASARAKEPSASRRKASDKPVG
jgi:endonuclease III